MEFRRTPSSAMPKRSRAKWRILPDFTQYEINQFGDVRYKETKAVMTPKEQFGKHWYQLQKRDGVVYLRHRNELLATIPEFSF